MAKRVQALTLCLSRETITIFENLGLTDAQKADVGQIVTALQRYVDGQFNETIERRNFRRRRQQPGETFDDFLVSLRELAKTCKFCTEECLQKHIRDQIIEGLVDGDTIDDLLKEKDLALDTASQSAEHRKLPGSNGQKCLVMDRSMQFASGPVVCQLSSLVACQLSSQDACQLSSSSPIACRFSSKIVHRFRSQGRVVWGVVFLNTQGGASSAPPIVAFVISVGSLAIWPKFVRVGWRQTLIHTLQGPFTLSPRRRTLVHTLRCLFTLSL